jgi:L-threonylcarbamoyladenylate synthase
VAERPTGTRLFEVDAEQPDVRVLQVAARTLRAGGLVAFPTETVYGLGVNARLAAAVERLYRVKGRPASDPLIVHIADRSQLEAVTSRVPDVAKRLGDRFWPGPLTLVLERHPDIPPNVSAGLGTVAVRMPSHPVARGLIRQAGVPVAAPSANLFSRPSPTTAAHVMEDLGGRIDIVLDAGPTRIGIESTVVDLTGGTPAILRPGGVPLEALLEIVPDVRPPSASGISGRAGSPGLFTRHYSPRARLVVFTGPLSRVHRAMQQAAGRYLAAGRTVGLMLPDEEREPFVALPVQLARLGSSAQLEQVAARLFSAMRELDRAGVDVMFVREFGGEGLGPAIRDRVIRAASGRLVRADHPLDWHLLDSLILDARS